MSITLHADTSVVVIPVVIDKYDAPPVGLPQPATQLDELPKVSSDFALLTQLFESAQYKAAGFQMLDAIAGGSAGTITDRLTAVKHALAARPNLIAILYWTGHGADTVNGLRLATSDCFEPIEGSDGIGPGEAVGKLADSRIEALLVLLDVCQAAAAAGQIATAVAKRSFDRTPETPFGLSALFSAYPLQRARDGAFVETLTRLLRDGSSPAATAAMQQQDWKALNPYNRRLTLKEVEEALDVEFDIIKRTNPTLASPAGAHSGTTPRVFPNPSYRPNAPSVVVEEKRLRGLRHEDVGTHFLPKARGLEPGEEGWFFSGRREVSREIVDWLQGGGGAAGENLFVLTGAGGSCKSAVVGRLVTLSDDDCRAAARVAGWDESSDRRDGTLPPLGAIDAALHLRKLTAPQVAQMLAELLGMGAPELPVQLESFVSGARIHANNSTRPLCVVLDALDESDEPRLIADGLIRPLALKGWRIIVASRRAASDRGASDLLALLGQAHWHDLDQEAASETDIAAYAKSRLEKSAGSTYVAWPELSAAIASAIGHRAAGKFLYARITVAGLLRRAEPIALAQIDQALAVDVNDALDREVRVLDVQFRKKFGSAEHGATALFAALAWGEGEGLPLRDDIWPAVASAIARTPIGEEQVRWILREGGRFIVESGDGDQAVYRLYHQSLTDYFRPAPDPAVSERIAATLEQNVGKAGGWTKANPYLVRYLPTHLAQVLGQDGLQRILFDFAWMSAKLEQSGIQPLLADYARFPRQDETLQRVERTLSMTAHILGRSPKQLAAQLLGRLSGDTEPALRALCAQAANWRGRTWLRPLLPQMPPPGALLRVLEGHEGRVTCTAFSPDGKWIVSGSEDGTLRIWDAGNGQQFGAPLRGHEGAVTVVSFSPDGKWVVSGSADATLRLWDAKRVQFTGISLQGHTAPVTCVAFSRDGEQIVSGGEDHSVRLWTAANGESFGRPFHEHQVTTVAFSPDDASIFTASSTGRWGEWDANSSEPLCLPIEWIDIRATCTAFSPEGMRIVVGGDDGSLMIYHARYGELICARIEGHASRVTNVAFSADGQRVVSTGHDGMIRLWDAWYGQAIGVPIFALEYSPTRAEFSPDGSRIVSTGSDNSLQLWDSSAAIDGRAAFRPAAAINSLVICMAFSPDGASILSGYLDHSVRLWDANTGEPIGELAWGRQSPVTHIAISPDAKRIVFGSDNTLRVWHVGKNRPIGEPMLHGRRDQVMNVAFSPDGTAIASLGTVTLRLWDAMSGRPTGVVRHANKGAVSSLAFSPDGTRIVAASGRDRARVWDAKSFKPIGSPLRAQGIEFAHLAFSSDGDRIVSVDRDQTLRWWNASSGKRIGEPVVYARRSPKEIGPSVAFSQDRTRIVEARGKTLWLLDAQTGETLFELELGNRIGAVAWHDETVAAWDASDVMHLLRVMTPVDPPS